MKKAISLLLAFVCLFSLRACGGEEEKPAAHIRVAAMTGPTGIGMAKLMSDAEEKRTSSDRQGDTYEVSVYGTAREITPLLIQGELDAAALPANLAATLYRKTEGEIQVAAVNTLGVLYVVQKGDRVKDISDLKGKKIYTTGKGTTPEYTLRYILTENGIDPDSDVEIEYLSEAAEVGARISAAEGDIIAMLPQPYVTAVTNRDPRVTVALDLSREWDKISDRQLVTGVLVVRKDFLRENKEAFDLFLDEYENSVNYAAENPAQAAPLTVKYGIIAREPLAKKAIPRCNLSYMDGRRMKKAVENYLSVLFRQSPESVGGSEPGEDFYYMG